MNLAPPTRPVFLARPRSVFLALLALPALLMPSVAEAASRSKRSSARSDHSDVARWIHHQGSRTLDSLFRDELNTAKGEGRGVIVMFTADWCAPCKEIKTFVAGSGAVRKALAHGRLLYIDVDEWRGPAHRLIEDINPTKLPTLVRVGPIGRVVRTCFGTDLGLLSEDSVAHNLGRLLAGAPPDKPFYDGKPEIERELIRKLHDAREARSKGEAELTATVRGRGAKARLSVTIHNHDGPRRWYLIPANLRAGLSETPTVTAWHEQRFDEHVRAAMLRFDGPGAFWAVPVAGYGSATIDGLPVMGTPKGGKLEVWALDKLEIDGLAHPFQQKLPYRLEIRNASKVVEMARHGNATLGMRVRTRLTARLR